MSCASAVNVTIPVVQQGGYQDGNVFFDGTVGLADGAIQVGQSGGVFRGFIDFNITMIPDNAIITNVTLQLNEISASVSLVNITQLHNISSSYSGSALFNDCIAGNTYVGSSNIWNGGGVYNVTLGSLANSDLQNKLINNSFSVCFLGRDESSDLLYFDEVETGASPAVLTVEYTTSSLGTLNLTLVSPSANSNVQKDVFFEFSLNVSCTGAGGAGCGDVNVSLDPADVSASDVSYGSSSGSADSASGEYESSSAKETGFFGSVWLAIADFFKMIGRITGFVAGSGLVNTTAGGMPFYTNMSNPLNGTDFACLGNMSSGESCLIYWWVNATNSSGTYEFFAFANSSLGLSAITGRINLTIQADASPPIITTIDEFDPYFAAPVIQHYGGMINFSANVTDNANVSSVWLNISNGTSPNYIFNMPGAGGIYSIELNSTMFGLGTRNFTIYANDSSNNINQTIIKNFTIDDLMKPAIANISILPTYPNPASNVYINATITDNYALDSAWARIVLPNGTSQNYSMSNSSSLFNLTYATSIRGRYTVYFYANDTSGNLRSTEDIPRYFYVPPVVFTDRDAYTQTQTILITGFGFSTDANITITIGNSTTNITSFNTSSTGTGLISDSYAIPMNAASGYYKVYAWDAGLSVLIFKEIKIEGTVINYPVETLVIPGDDKQNPDAYDMDFLEMYGAAYDMLNQSYKLDWIITPECIRLNATNVDTNIEYNELFCHGFWLIKENLTSALADLNSIRGSVQILELNENASIPKSQIIQLRRIPRVGVLSGSEGQITSTLTRSSMPYTILSESDIMNNSIFNFTKYDILLIGDYDFMKASSSLAGNISVFVNNGGDVHAEDQGAITLDNKTSFLGNLREDGSYSGNSRIITSSNPITQIHLDTFANSYGTSSVFDVSSASNAYTVFTADVNNPPATNVKLIGMNVGKGYATYSGGHIGSAQGSSEYSRPKNRLLNNLIFYSIQVNDLTEPESWGLTPSASTNVSIGQPINISAYVTDNVQIDRVWAVINWNSTTTTIYLNGPDVINFFWATFTNTTSPGRYNVTLFANDTRGNIETAETWFNVISSGSATCALTINPASPTYPSQVNASCSCTNPETSAMLWRNNLNATAENNLYINLSAGNYSYVCNSSATANYSYASASQNITVARANSAVNLLLDGTDGNINEHNGTSINLTAYLTTGQGSITVYRNGAAINSGLNPLYNQTLFNTEGVYNITVIYAGNQNYSSSFETHWITITNSTSPSTDPDDSGGACSDLSWTCEAWGSCLNNVRARICTSNCDNQRIETESCAASCTNQCTAEGDYCDGNNVMHCSLVSECYESSFVKICTDNSSCQNGECVGIGEIDKLAEFSGSSLVVSTGGSVWDWIDKVPHGNIPDFIVGGTAVIVATGTAIWLGWTILLWLGALIVPFFLLKLRHYIVYVFDTSNSLGIIRDKKADKRNLLELLEDVGIEFENPTFADKSEEMIKYLFKKGFLEARVDEPFILAGHFTSEGEADKFEKALKKVVEKRLGKDRAKELRVERNVEKASIIEIIRAYFRKKRTEKEMEKVFSK